MVLHALADGGVLDNHGDGVLGQNLGGADTGQLEDLRGLERAGGQDHFELGGDLADGAVDVDLDAGGDGLAGGGGVEEDLVDVGVGQDLEVVAGADLGGQVGDGGEGARLGGRVDGVGVLEGAESQAVAVVGLGEQVHGLKGVEPALVGDAVALAEGHLDRAVAVGDSLVVVGDVGDLLGSGRGDVHGSELLEVRLERIVVPAGVADRGPGVDGGLGRVDKHHEVDAGGTAEHLAAGLVDDAVVEGGLLSLLTPGFHMSWSLPAQVSE